MEEQWYVIQVRSGKEEWVMRCCALMIDDPCAAATYYCCCMQKDHSYYHPLFHRLHSFQK